MKKFLIILLFITSFISAQETIKIGDFDLTIPKDYSDLKNAYIIMTNLYLESDAALSKSNENFKNLKTEYDKVVKLLNESEADNKTLLSKINDKLIPNTIKLEDQINVLTKELNKWVKPDLFQLYIGGSFSNEIVPDIHVGVFANLIIYEQYSIKVEYLFLDQYSIGIGYKF